MANAIVVEFDETVQSLDALNAAAYRLLDVANCVVEKRNGKFFCQLCPKQASADGDAIRLRFLDSVTDENLRESLAVKTEPVRNLILSLAFGALVSKNSSDAG
jgi:His-Xaa-Ser system protein HxsD